MHKKSHNGLPPPTQPDIASKKDYADISTDTTDEHESVQDALEREMFERAR